MALIKNAQAGTMARDAVVLDLGDLYRQGEVIRAEARDEARRLVENAGVEADKIIEDGMARGFEEGRVAGMEQGRAAGFEAGRNEAFEEQFTRLQTLITGWTGALEVFLESRESLVRDARQDILELAVRVAERVLKREIEHDTGSAARQLEAVLALVLQPSTLRVEINVKDRDAVAAALPGLLATFATTPHAEVLDAADVSPGGCRVRTESGMIDAEIETQLDRLVDELLSCGASARWEAGEPSSDVEAGEESSGESESDPEA